MTVILKDANYFKSKLMSVEAFSLDIKVMALQMASNEKAVDGNQPTNTSGDSLNTSASSNSGNLST